MWVQHHSAVLGTLRTLGEVFATHADEVQEAWWDLVASVRLHAYSLHRAGSMRRIGFPQHPSVVGKHSSVHSGRRTTAKGAADSCWGGAASAAGVPRTKTRGGLCTLLLFCEACRCQLTPCFPKCH